VRTGTVINTLLLSAYRHCYKHTVVKCVQALL